MGMRGKLHRAQSYSKRPRAIELLGDTSRSAGESVIVAQQDIDDEPERPFDLQLLQLIGIFNSRIHCPQMQCVDSRTVGTDA